MFPQLQGRILKHAGDLVAAAALADEARSMDLADRFINSECVKRMLQADQVCLTVQKICYFLVFFFFLKILNIIRFLLLVIYAVIYIIENAYMLF